MLNDPSPMPVGDRFDYRVDAPTHPCQKFVRITLSGCGRCHNHHTKSNRPPHERDYESLDEKTPSLERIDCRDQLCLVIITGLLLQVKKQVSWVQPPTQRGREKIPVVDWQQILQAAKTFRPANVVDWGDVERLDVQPSKGLIKIQSRNHWEIQIDAATAEVLQSAYRRSDWIEQLHDGSFFSDAVKLWVFLPNGVVLLGL